MLNLQVETRDFRPIQHDAYKKLEEINLIKAIPRNQNNSASWNAPSSPSIIIAMKLCYIGEEKVKFIAGIFRTGITLVNRVINIFVDANSSTHLPYQQI